MISHSPAMRRLLETSSRVASSDASLLIVGETGAGKEWLARAIHDQSHRCAGPFVAVNCAAVPEHLLESEFFGHEKGAFTGAIRSRRGHFERATGGTLFLDEVSELPPHLQAKLLRALQEHRVQPVGAEHLVDVDARVIAATNRELAADMAVGRFRTDLYYRLGVVTLALPPLRERPEDIAALIDSGIAYFARVGKRPVPTVTPGAMAALMSYRWPGNVRELLNVIERAVLLSDGAELTPDHLPEGLARRPPTGTRAPSSPAMPLPADWHELPWRALRATVLAELERRYLTALLTQTRGRVSEAARRAGMDPRSLFDKLRQHGLRRESFRNSAQP